MVDPLSEYASEPSGYDKGVRRTFSVSLISPDVLLIRTIPSTSRVSELTVSEKDSMSSPVFKSSENASS